MYRGSDEAATVEGLSALQSDAVRRYRISVGTVLQDEREELRGRVPSPQPRVQPWIQQLIGLQETTSSMQPEERQDNGLGLVIYPVAHKFSDEQWESLQRTLEADFSTWSDGVQRADKLKPLLTLH